MLEYGDPPNNIIYTITDGKITITDCNPAATGHLEIPSIIKNKPVTSIGNNAFEGCEHLTSITIPDGVTSIGYRAFFNLGKDEPSENIELTIPDGVTSIDQNAFEGAYFTSITVVWINGITLPLLVPFMEHIN